MHAKYFPAPHGCWDGCLRKTHIISGSINHFNMTHTDNYLVLRWCSPYLVIVCLYIYMLLPSSPLLQSTGSHYLNLSSLNLIYIFTVKPPSVSTGSPFSFSPWCPSTNFCTGLNLSGTSVDFKRSFSFWANYVTSRRHRLTSKSVSRGMTVAFYSKNNKIERGSLAKWKGAITLNKKMQQKGKKRVIEVEDD